MILGTDQIQLSVKTLLMRAIISALISPSACVVGKAKEWSQCHIPCFLDLVEKKHVGNNWSMLVLYRKFYMLAATLIPVSNPKVGISSSSHRRIWKLRGDKKSFQIP